MTNMRAWKSLWKQILLQIRGTLRNRSSLIFSLALPIVIIVTIGAAAGGGDNVSFRVGLADQDASPVSQQLTTALRSVPILRVSTGDEADLRAQLRGGKLDAVAILPAGFGQQARAGGPARLQVVTNAANLSAGQAVVTTVDQVVSAYNLAAAGARPSVVVAAEQSAAAQTGGGGFLLGGVLALMLMTLNLTGIMMVTVQQRQSGVLRHIFSTPMPVWTWVVARIVANGLLSILDSALIIWLGQFFLKTHLNYQLGALLLVLVVGSYACLGLGLAIAAVVNRMELVQPLNGVINVVMQFFGQLWFPVTTVWLLPVAKLTPTYWLSDALRQVTTNRASISGVATDVAVLGVIAVVTIAFASWRFARLKQVA